MIKLVLFSIILLLNLLFCLMNHPMSLGIIMLLQTLMMTMTMGMISMNFWYSYIMFLIIVGALLILFIYMTSLVPNKKFKFSKSLMIIMMFLLIILFLMMYLFNDLFIMMINNKSIDMINMNKNNYKMFNENEQYSLLWMYDKLNYEMTLSLMNYLLYVLMVIVYIINIEMGTMRKLKN